MNLLKILYTKLFLFFVILCFLKLKLKLIVLDVADITYRIQYFFLVRSHHNNNISLY